MLGLATIYYQWNDLEGAYQKAERSIQLAQQIDSTDWQVGGKLMQARVLLAQGDWTAADQLVTAAEQFAKQRGFQQRLPAIAAVRVRLLLQVGHTIAAGEIAERFKLPLAQARVALAQGDAPAALAILDEHEQEMAARNWPDALLRCRVVRTMALAAAKETTAAEALLADVLRQAESGGFIRLFVDEGPAMGHLLSRVAAGSPANAYVQQLLEAFSLKMVAPAPDPSRSAAKSRTALVEPLSPRELEVLALVAEGLSNREIGERLFLALDTIKGHNRRIYGKLQVQRRTEAVARARELGLV